jgi:hypothetical protein
MNDELRRLLDTSFRLQESPALQAFRKHAEEMERLTAPFKQFEEQTKQFHSAIGALRIPALDHLAAFKPDAETSRRLDNFSQSMLKRRETFEPVLAFDPESLQSLRAPQAPVTVPPAVETLRHIQIRLDAERAEKEDMRHEVHLIVTLQDGSRLHNLRMSNDGDNLIRMQGLDLETSAERDVTVGPHAFQFEFVTIEKGPPDLRLVE